MDLLQSMSCTRKGCSKRVVIEDLMYKGLVAPPTKADGRKKKGRLSGHVPAAFEREVKNYCKRKNVTVTHFITQACREKMDKEKKYGV